MLSNEIHTTGHTVRLLAQSFAYRYTFWDKISYPSLQQSQENEKEFWLHWKWG
jgi:hypothetical protein